MAQRQPLLGFIERESFMHSLTGTTKLVMMLVASLAVMLGFDTRFLVLMLVVSVGLWVSSKISVRDLSLILWVVLVMMVLNNLMIFLFAPGYGEEIYGTSHILWSGWGRWHVSAEQLFYQLNVTLKYFAVIPIALLFIVTTSPSEFASSLNRVGVPYKVAYSVSLALRYIPDVQREFRDISHAQQARGIDTSRQVPFSQRLRSTAAILIPLLLSSLSRIETVATAMELRGFGTGKRRSWYVSRPLRGRDWVALAGSALVLAVAVALLWWNGSRFYNPFV